MISIPPFKNINNVRSNKRKRTFSPQLAILPFFSNSPGIFKQLVRVEKIEQLMLVDTKGKIIISSNKKIEGDQLATNHADSVLKIQELTILDETDKQIIAAPVLSIDKKLGTLIVFYKPDIFQWKE